MIFLNSASSAAALVFYLPCVCVQTLTPWENRESPEYFKIVEKNTIINEHIIPCVHVDRVWLVAAGYAASHAATVALQNKQG